MPKVSFVMPTKNREKLIGQAIESIVDQTISDWELIVIDDHSDEIDQTKKIVESFHDQRIRYYYLDDRFPKGIAHARNFGNQFALSPIIAVVDSDDLCKENRLEETIKAFEETNCDIFYSKYEIQFQETGEIRERKTPITDFSIEMMQQYNIIPHATSAYKREIAYDFPYNPFFHIGEDYDFFTRLGNADKKFYFCDKILYRVIVHGDNITGGKKFGEIETLIKANRGWIETDRSSVIDAIFSERK
jgi:glycosyltransferase involved in cell wall biosynthesis